MNRQTKSNIRSKTRLIYGLVHVLKEDIDNLRIDVNSLDINRMKETIQDTNETLEKITDIVADIEYIIYLNTLK